MRRFPGFVFTTALTGNADGSFALSHLYQQAGDYVVTVTVTDSDGAVGAAEFVSHVVPGTAPGGAYGPWVTALQANGHANGTGPVRSREETPGSSPIEPEVARDVLHGPNTEPHPGGLAPVTQTRLDHTDRSEPTLLETVFAQDTLTW